MHRLEHDHDSASIRRRFASGPPVSYLRDWVYGGIDGAVTTFAVVAGTMGADLSSRIVLILGAANLVGDGFSMAASNFSGTKAERDEYAQLRAVEEGMSTSCPTASARRSARSIARRVFAATTSSARWR